MKRPWKFQKIFMGEIRTDQCLRQKRSFCGEQNEVLILPLCELFLKRLRNDQVKNGQLFKPVVLRESKLFMRVWSWLRMNAGGVLNTCKSNEAPFIDWRACSKRFEWWLSGGRVSNAWVTCLIQGDNSWKRLLIPHKRTVPHGTVWKTPVVWDGPASD